MTIRLLAILIISLALTVAPLNAAGPTTLENDDSCDIALAPAATLLLPYFEVDLENVDGETTLFTITNVTSIEQVARVTLWTDLAYPVVTFNIYLTGYDMQSLNLYDVLARGVIGPRLGTGTWVSHVGELSEPNRRLDVSNCGVITPRLDASVITRMQEAFTLGSIAGFCTSVGMSHENAVGYATIDVVGNCSTNGPTDPDYFTEDIRYDNALIGDYQQVNGGENFAHKETRWCTSAPSPREALLGFARRGCVTRRRSSERSTAAFRILLTPLRTLVNRCPRRLRRDGTTAAQATSRPRF